MRRDPGQGRGRSETGIQKQADRSVELAKKYETGITPGRAKELVGEPDKPG